MNLNFLISEIERQVREGKGICEACSDIKKIIKALENGENVMIHCTDKEIKVQKYKINKI